MRTYNHSALYDRWHMMDLHMCCLCMWNDTWIWTWDNISRCIFMMYSHFFSLKMFFHVGKMGGVFFQTKWKNTGISSLGLAALRPPGAREASASPRSSEAQGMDEDEPLAIESLGHCSGLMTGKHDIDPVSWNKKVKSRYRYAMTCHTWSEWDGKVSVFPNLVSDIDTKKRLHCKSWVFSSSLKACKCVQGNSMAARHCMVADVGCNMLLQVRRVVPVLGKLPYFRLVPGWWNTISWSNGSVSSFTTWLPREWVSFGWSLDGKELEGANMYRLPTGDPGCKESGLLACFLGRPWVLYRCLIFLIMGFDVALGSCSGRFYINAGLVT